MIAAARALTSAGIEDARSIVTSLGDRLDGALMQREIAALAAELPDHDIAARFHRVTR